MLKSHHNQELPDCCYYPNQPVLILPNTPTPNHSLYLSNLDDQKFLRFSIKYLYLFKKSISLDILKYSLSKVLVDYYPLAGRLRTSSEDDQKLEVDCNGQGALFASAFMDISSEDFLQLSRKPNWSWRKLLYRVEAHSFLDIPPLVVQSDVTEAPKQKTSILSISFVCQDDIVDAITWQRCRVPISDDDSKVTNLRCGGMILCTAMNHCLCDGIGSSQFLHAWAHMTTPNTNLDLPMTPFHTRHELKPRNPPQVNFTHHGCTKTTPKETAQLEINQYLHSQPLVPASLTFTPSQILHLKRQCVPSLKCTTFEALASHTWRSWVRSLDLSPTLKVKLLFSVNVRKILNPEMPEGYYGNGFVLGCAQTSANELVNTNLYHTIKLVQQAKASLTDDYVRSMIDLLKDKSYETDLSSSLVISQWSKLGLEDLDFGEGKPLHMGPVSSSIYCLFLPVTGDFNSVRVLVSMPGTVVEKFEYYMTEFLDREENN